MCVAGKVPTTSASVVAVIVSIVPDAGDTRTAAESTGSPMAATTGSAFKPSNQCLGPQRDVILSILHISEPTGSSNSIIIDGTHDQVRPLLLHQRHERKQQQQQKEAGKWDDGDAGREAHLVLVSRTA